MSPVRTMATVEDRASVGSMKRRGGTGKLATVGDLAVMLGRSRQTALSVSQHWSFPVPVDVLNPTTRPMAVWWRKDIEKWVAENQKPVADRDERDIEPRIESAWDEERNRRERDR